MSNTPSDDILFELIKEHFGLDKRPFDTVIDRKTGRFHDAARYRDFASAVLARWGSPQPVVREPELDQFLSDVMTAAGLVTHGKQCKQLGERLGAAVMKLRVHNIPQKGCD